MVHRCPNSPTNVRGFWVEVHRRVVLLDSLGPFGIDTGCNEDADYSPLLRFWIVRLFNPAPLPVLGFISSGSKISRNQLILYRIKAAAGTVFYFPVMSPRLTKCNRVRSLNLSNARQRTAADSGRVPTRICSRRNKMRGMELTGEQYEQFQPGFRGWR